MNKELSGLKRAKQPMPAFVQKALNERGLMAAYLRAAYQRNDYLGWIARARKEDTKQRRLGQRPDELEVGGVYMNMKHPSSAKPT